MPTKRSFTAIGVDGCKGGWFYVRISPRPSSVREWSPTLPVSAMAFAYTESLIVVGKTGRGCHRTMS